MPSQKQKPSNRKLDRIRAVLPVRVRGKDTSGAVFETLAHTLDLTPAGARAIGMSGLAPVSLAVVSKS